MKGLKFIFTNVLAIVVSATMLVGSTFAWFTDSNASAVNQIKSGNLDVKLSYSNMYNENYVEVEETTKIFTDVNGEDILWEPGAFASGRFKVENNGSLALKYKFNLLQANATKTESGKTLADVLNVYALTRNKSTGDDGIMQDSNLQELGIDSAVPGYEPDTRVLKEEVELEAFLLPGESITYEIGVYWNATENDNEYNVEGGLSIDFMVSLVATQYNYETDGDGFNYDVNSEYPQAPSIPDTWDGTVDYSWYNDTDTVFTLTTAEQFAGLTQLVDGTAAMPADVSIELPVTFEGKTVKLDTDVDLKDVLFEPIGSYRKDTAFKGTFDGQGHTISNLSQNTWELNNGYYYGDLGLGLFGKVEDATIKNLTIDGADISGESAICGTIAATAYGDCTFENITVKNANVADYQYYAGGIVGWASGNHTYVNCNIDASTNIAAQWGDFDNSIGGVIGGAGDSATILLKDCTVACRIDAYNDVTSSYQWYAYRRAGMLIGNPGQTATIDNRTVAVAPQLTCENVTVIYGEWANYTYCEFAGTNWPYVRVQEGVSNGAYSNPRYGNPTDANGNKVVDDNHVHNEGEDHFVLCAFDQLYGGGQGVYGTPSHDGVTVIYNNK